MKKEWVLYLCQENLVFHVNITCIRILAPKRQSLQNEMSRTLTTLLIPRDKYKATFPQLSLKKNLKHLKLLRPRRHDLMIFQHAWSS